MVLFILPYLLLDQSVIKRITKTIFNPQTAVNSSIINKLGRPH